MIDGTSGDNAVLSMSPELQAFLKEINHIPWFRHVGEPVPNDEVRQVSSWGDAYDCLQDESWTDASLHEHIDQGHPIWIEVYNKARDAAAASSDDHWFSPEVDAAMQAGWDAAGAAYEIATNNPDKSYQGLMKWYRQGHWPCGWDGSYPKGRLIVY